MSNEPALASLGSLLERGQAADNLFVHSVLVFGNNLIISIPAFPYFFTAFKGHICALEANLLALLPFPFHELSRAQNGKVRVSSVYKLINYVLSIQEYPYFVIGVSFMVVLMLRYSNPRVQESAVGRSWIFIYPN